MALSTKQWIRSKLNPVLPKNIDQNAKLFDNGDDWFLDVYTAVDGDPHLEKRFLIIPSGYEGGNLVLTFAELDYSTHWAAAYNPTDSETATNTPFELTNGGTPKIIGTSSTLNLDLFFAAGGEPKTNS